MELNTARIFVRDLEAARAFYGETLRLPLKADSAEHGYCVCAAGAAHLVVENVPDDAPDEDQDLVGRFTGPSFTVTDIDEVHRSLAALGVRLTGMPERQAWGGILATLLDRAGNALQTVQLPTGLAPGDQLPGPGPG